MIRKIFRTGLGSASSCPRYFLATKAGSLNFYDLLEVKPGCSQKDIKASFARLAKIYHPDVYKGSDKSRFQRLNEAYETLKNVSKRREYDINVLGLKSEDSYERERAQESKDTGEAPKDNEMYNFDGFQGKEGENISEEFNKFIQKPVQHPPDTVIVVEDPFLRQLDMEERIRYEVKNYGNNPELYDLKYGHQKGYRKSADEVVEILNEQSQPEAVKEYKAKFVQERIKKLKTAGVWVFWLFVMPVFVYAARKRALQKREIIEEMMKLEKKEIARETEEFRSRIVFMGDEDRKSRV